MEYLRVINHKFTDDAVFHKKFNVKLYQIYVKEIYKSRNYFLYGCKACLRQKIITRAPGVSLYCKHYC